MRKLALMGERAKSAHIRDGWASAPERKLSVSTGTVNFINNQSIRQTHDKLRAVVPRSIAYPTGLYALVAARRYATSLSMLIDDKAVIDRQDASTSYCLGRKQDCT